MGEEERGTERERVERDRERSNKPPKRVYDVGQTFRHGGHPTDDAGSTGLDIFGLRWTKEVRPAEEAASRREEEEEAGRRREEEAEAGRRREEEEAGWGMRWEWVPPVRSASDAVPPRTRFPLLSLSPSVMSPRLLAQKGRWGFPLT